MMIRQFFLWFFLSYSFVCYASDNCINKELSEHHVFYQSNQRYDFSSYDCGYDNQKFTSPVVLKIKGNDLNVTLKNVIGHRGMIDIGISDWYHHPSLYFYSGSSTRTEAYMTLVIENKAIFIDCIYVSSRLKNLLNAQYSFCGQQQLLVDGLDIEDLIPDFYLEPLFETTDYSVVEQHLSNQPFDILTGKFDDLSIYRRYLSQNDYMSEKYDVIISSKDKQHQFKNSNIYQRMANESDFIGLDVASESNDIVFYDKKSLLKLLNISTDKRNIQAYIQRDRATLYDEPNNKNLINMYLVKGDTVIILDEYLGGDNDLWFKVSYKSKKLGEIVKWIKGNAFKNF